MKQMLLKSNGKDNLPSKKGPLRDPYVKMTSKHCGEPISKGLPLLTAFSKHCGYTRLFILVWVGARSPRICVQDRMTTVGICVQDKVTLNHDDGGREFLEFSE